ELGALRERLRKHEEEAPAWLQRAQAEGWVPQDEHTRATAALQEQARALRERLSQLEAAHEAAEAGLRAEAAALAQRLQELERRHEKTCEEVFRVQRQAKGQGIMRGSARRGMVVLEMAATAAPGNLSPLCPVQITELSKEVFRLKEALNAHPESGGSPKSPPNTAALQAQVRALEEKLEETETRHSKVVTLYRSHLLYAVQ
ncbi:ANR24 protein, partial [Hippolais icterina]|nr:ANR24 protein [Hippolais icterina]